MERQARREARMAARSDRNRANPASGSSSTRSSGSSRTGRPDGKGGGTHPSASHQPVGPSSSQANQSAGHHASPAEKGMLIRLRDGYKKAALNHKLNKDVEAALKMIRIAKQLDMLIQAINEKQPVDLRGLPPPAPAVRRRSTERANARPTISPTSVIPVVQVTDDAASSAPHSETIDAAPTRKRVNPEEYTRRSSNASFTGLTPIPSGRGSPTPSASSAVSSGNITSDDVARLFNAPTTAGSVLEALDQRIAKYRATEEAAKAEGNASKARRLGRIVRQYESAVDAYKNKKDFDYDSLPVPPGFPPIPFDLPAEPTRRGRPRAPDPPPPSPRPVKSEASAAAVPSNYRPKTELNAKVDSLTQLQSTLKQAALEHKRTGEVQEAIQYMKLAKGFDPIVEAIKCGLPVDESTIPEIPDEVMLKLQQLNLGENQDK